MPTLPGRPCSVPGCRNLKPCAEHSRERQRQADRRRGTSTQRGYGIQWQESVEQWRAENPESSLCVECRKEGRSFSRTEVDHIIPHRGNQELFWDRTNWQALCKRHHSIKTAREDGGFGNAQSARR